MSKHKITMTWINDNDDDDDDDNNNNNNDMCLWCSTCGWYATASTFAEQQQLKTEHLAQPVTKMSKSEMIGSLLSAVSQLNLRIDRLLQSGVPGPPGMPGPAGPGGHDPRFGMLATQVAQLQADLSEHIWRVRMSETDDTIEAPKDDR